MNCLTALSQTLASLTSPEYLFGSVRSQISRPPPNSPPKKNKKIKIDGNGGGV